jgi:hypothetical protein
MAGKVVHPNQFLADVNSRLLNTFNSLPMNPATRDALRGIRAQVAGDTNLVLADLGDSV